MQLGGQMGGHLGIKHESFINFELFPRFVTRGTQSKSFDFRTPKLIIFFYSGANEKDGHLEL